MSLTTASPSFARACSGQAFLTILSAVLFAPSVQAQPAIPEARPATSVQPAATFVAPKYSSTDIGRAFGFMDSNKDGKVSREEAAGFKNVARHFTAADTDKDELLSRGEFESALNHRKSR
jgi:hypothetical protein